MAPKMDTFKYVKDLTLTARMSVFLCVGVHPHGASQIVWWGYGPLMSILEVPALRDRDAALLPLLLKETRCISCRLNREGCECRESVYFGVGGVYGGKHSRCDLDCYTKC